VTAARAVRLFLRSLWRSALFVALLLAAAVDCRLRQPKVGAEGAVWIHRWCRRIVRALGFECDVEGVMPTSGAVVSNHLSYLDILLYSSVQPFVMVAKKEV
jgi:lyso-ornithine lipid O-acyltransferase